jgi:uncharacterized repeat protein (TIGR01451 family)
MRAASRFAIVVLTIVIAGCLRNTAEEGGSPQSTTNENIRTRISRLGLTANPTPDAYAVRLDVKPLESTGAPGSRCLVIATITDSEGQPRRQKKIEWSLDGVGEIAAADSSSYLSVLERQPQSKFAVSYSAAVPRTIKGEAGEDVLIAPGQSWCVLTSGVEGDARLTVHCPEIANAAAREAFVTRRWADVSWNIPSPQAVRVGDAPALVCQVIRTGDRLPAGNYAVRYRLLDGPPSLFVPSQSQESEVEVTNGQAPITLIQRGSRPGKNRISVELIKMNPSMPEADRVVIARGETAVTWESPQIALSIQSPSAAVAGQDVPAIITVKNTGAIATGEVQLRMPAVEGALFVSADPPARDDGGQLFWTLPNLAAAGTHSIRAVFRTAKPQVLHFAAAAQSRDCPTVHERTTTRVGVAELIAELKAPPTAAPDDPVTYDATVTNAGSGPAANVVLHAAYDEGLEHSSQAHPVELRVGILESGKSRSIPLTFTPRQAGTFRVRLTASADGNLRGEAIHTLSVSGKLLDVSLTGPATRYADRSGSWDVRVANPGAVPLTNVMVRVQLPPEVECRGVSDKGQYSARQAVWSVGSLLAGEHKQFQVTAAALRLAAQTQLGASASADGVAERTAIAPLEILGAPALRAEIIAPSATLPLKSKIVYRIVVRNAGSLAARNVAISAELTPSILRPLAATGPTIARISGNRVEFEPLERLDAKQAATFFLEAEAGQLGDGRLRIQVKTDHASQSAGVDEPTLVIPAQPEQPQGNGSR